VGLELVATHVGHVGQAAVGEEARDLAGADAERERLLHRSASGWATINPPVQHSVLMEVWGSGANDVWAVGLGSSTLHWDGQAWSAVPNPGMHDLRAVWGTGPRDVWSVGNAGTTLHFDGQSRQVPSPTTEELTHVCGSAKDDVWAVGRSSTVLHWDGPGWSAGASPAGGDIWSCWSGAARRPVGGGVHPLGKHDPAPPRG
jgi:hypothetical protein